jgi:DNA-binding PadR family transcriptional regulator
MKGMRRSGFLILSALAVEPLHGYGIILAVERMSGGEVRLAVGTLYGALDRLAGEAQVEVDHEEVVQGRLRRYYRLTGSGRVALAEELTRRERELSAVRAEIGQILAGFGSPEPL